MRLITLSILSIFILSSCGSKPKAPDTTVVTADTTHYPHEPQLDFHTVGTSFVNSPDGSKNTFYTVFVDSFSDTYENWAKIKFDAQQRIKDGFSGVLYYNSEKHTPALTNGKGLDVPEADDKYCIAGYWTYLNGTTKFKKYPMK